MDNVKWLAERVKGQATAAAAYKRARVMDEETETPKKKPKAKTTGSSNELGKGKRSKKVQQGSKLTLPKEREEAPLRTLIQAFDLGTTYSGAAYAVVSEDPSEKSVKVVSDWHKAPWHGHTHKTPTAIAFRSDDRNGDLEENEWGYAIGKDRKRSNWFKLLFAASGNREGLNDPLLQQTIGTELARLPEGKSVEEVLQEMYRLLAEKCHQNARDRSGLDDVDRMPTLTIITVPAEYCDIKKAAIRQIVEKAQVSKSSAHEIRIITECEAVCYKVVHENKETGDICCKTRGTTMVLDIGGGSFDITTCVMKKRNPPQFQEACNSRGVYHGSTSVCRSFVKWCGEVFGNAYIALSVEHRSAGSQFMKDFEDCMRVFDGRSDDETFSVQLPQLAEEFQKMEIKSHPNYDFKKGSIQFTAVEMCGFFQTLREAIFETIRGQIRELNGKRETAEQPKDRPPELKTLILAGGFAYCEYVCHMLQKFWHKELQGAGRMVVAKDPWSSVVFGAVLAGLFPEMLQYRRSSRCVGIAVTRPFKVGINNNDDIYECESQGLRAKGYIKWLFRRGDSFKPGKTKEYVVVQLAINRNEPKAHFYLNTYACEKYLKNEKPDRIDDPDVRLLAKAQIEFDVPKTLWRNKTERVRMVNVTFSVALDGGLGEFQIEAKIGHKVVHNLRYEFEAEASR